MTPYTLRRRVQRLTRLCSDCGTVEIEEYRGEPARESDAGTTPGPLALAADAILVVRTFLVTPALATANAAAVLAAREWAATAILIAELALLAPTDATVTTVAILVALAGAGHTASFFAARIAAAITVSDALSASLVYALFAGPASFGSVN